MHALRYFLTHAHALLGRLGWVSRGGGASGASTRDHTKSDFE